MMTPSNGNIFRVTGPLCGEFTGPGEFPTQRPMTRSFDVFFDLRLNKRLSKQPWGWWFETPSWSLWRHRNALKWCLWTVITIWYDTVIWKPPSYWRFHYAFATRKLGTLLSCRFIISIYHDHFIDCYVMGRSEATMIFTVWLLAMVVTTV